MFFAFCIFVLTNELWRFVLVKFFIIKLYTSVAQHSTKTFISIGDDIINVYVKLFY